MDPFTSLLTEMRPSLLRCARRRLRNGHWAEDAVSETVMAALQRRPAFTEPGRVRAWLFGILRHKVTDQLRVHLGSEGMLSSFDQTEDESAEISDPCPFADPMHRIADSQFIEALDRQLERMPRAHAEAFVMRECLGKETAEICDELAISAGNLFVMLHRARSRLRQTLAEHRG